MKRLLTDRLSKLKRDEFNRFELFVQSPYFQKSEKYVQLFQLIKPFYPEFVIPKSTYQKINKLYTSEVAYNVLLSRMNDVLDEFELYELFQSKTHLKNALKYELELDKKNNLKYYQTLEKTEQHIIQNSDDLYAAFYKEFSSIALCENNWLSNKEKILQHSDNALSNIMQFFLSKYLMTYANKTTHLINLAQQPEEKEENKIILNFVQDSIEQQPLSVCCLFYIIQLFKNINGNNSEFDKYYQLLKSQTFDLATNEISYEIKYALIQASSACIFKCYAEPSYLQNAFELIQFLIEKDLYFSVLHQPLTQQRFILIVKVALGANQVEWAKKFIESKISLIDKELQNDFYNYALGLIYYNQQDYNAAVKLMIKINLNTPQYLIDYKITLLKMQYELNELSNFNYQSQTFLKFMKKDKSLSKMHKKNVLDSIEFIKILFKYKNNKIANDFLEKLESKKIDYLITNYRDKWYAEKYNTINKVK